MEEKINNLTMGTALILSLIIAGVYYLAAYNDGAALEANINNLQRSYDENKAEIERVRKAIEDAERYQQIMAELGSEMERVQRAIPSSLTEQEMMRLISNEANVVKIEIAQISAQGAGARAYNPDPNAVQFYEPIRIDINLKGTYSQLMQFLSNLTKTDKIITANKVTINLATSTRGTASPILEMRASIEAYRYLSPENKEAKGG